MRQGRVASGRVARRGTRPAALALLAGSAAMALAACGGSGGSSSAGQSAGPAAGSAAASQSKTENITLIGKIDADSGAPGTFTGKEDWPATAPSDIHVSPGATVVLTIKEYDDMVTELPDGSPYNAVAGGTETVDGNTVTTVSNSDIAHTITIPALGINIPLPKAPKDGVTTIQFTFHAPASGGTYLWECMTPCGSGPNGTMGAMHMDGWMRGHLIVS